jgi:pSer/pThr/pTyr-binding forkhead associated (FHA) protein
MQLKSTESRINEQTMPASISSANASLEVVFSGRASQLIELKEFPFYIGRGQGSGNQLALDDMRISRNCAVITAEGSAFLLQDRGQREGIFVNGLQATLHPLNNGDRIRLGNDEGCQLIFRLPSEQATQEEAESKLRSILGSIGSDSGDELKGLKLLLEATSLMHSQLPRCSTMRSRSPEPTEECCWNRTTPACFKCGLRVDKVARVFLRSRCIPAVPCSPVPSRRRRLL